MDIKRIIFIVSYLLCLALMGCSGIPDMPGPIGIPGI